MSKVSSRQSLKFHFVIIESVSGVLQFKPCNSRFGLALILGKFQGTSVLVLRYAAVLQLLLPIMHDEDT